MPLLKQLFKPTNRDLLKRIGFTLVALAIFIIGTTIQVPGTDSITSNLGFLELVNTMGGGALQNFSIFALGVMPYITATIVMQLLGELIPYFQDLNKQGHVGRQKINTYSRYMGILFAFIQGYAFSFMFLGRTASAAEYIYISVVLTAGTAFLLWLGDQITRKGIGNGLSLIIMAGIIATLPQMFIDAFGGLVIFDGTAQEITLGIVKFILFAIIYFAIIVGVIFVQMAERKVPIQYANKSTSYGQSAASYVPIKVNTAVRFSRFLYSCYIRPVDMPLAGTIFRYHLRICQPTVSDISREATILSARVSTHASEFLGIGARGNIWLVMAARCRSLRPKRRLALRAAIAPWTKACIWVRRRRPE